MKTAILILIATVAFTAETITAVTIPSWPPFMYEEEDSVKGIATDIVRVILDSSHVEYEIKTYPWARAFLTAQESKDHMLFIVYRTPERENMFRWVGPILPSYDMSFYKLKSAKDVVLGSLDDAKQYRVGVVRNVANHKYLLSMGFVEGKNLFPVPTPEMNCQKLIHHRIDLLISNEFTLPLLLQNTGNSMEQVERTFDVLESEPGYIAFNPYTADSTVAKVQKSFELLKYQNVLDSIYNAYRTSFEPK